MLMVVIFLCVVLIGFNAFYNDDEFNQKNEVDESKIKNNLSKLNKK